MQSILLVRHAEEVCAYMQVGCCVGRYLQSFKTLASAVKHYKAKCPSRTLEVILGA